MKTILLIAALFISSLPSIGQHIGMTFQEAKALGLTSNGLDSIYKSAVGSDTSTAVFKTNAAQDTLVQAYRKLLQDLGIFLSKSNFYWDRPTKCWHRVYFNKDGTIDYFLYNFLTKDVKPEELLSTEKQLRFQQLLNAFIREYKIPLTATTKFAQCSTITFTTDDH